MIDLIKVIFGLIAVLIIFMLFALLGLMFSFIGSLLIPALIGFGICAIIVFFIYAAIQDFKDEK